ncbi:hypothetical protein D9M70_647000 [compost metagenome]
MALAISVTVTTRWLSRLRSGVAAFASRVFFATLLTGLAVRDEADFALPVAPARGGRFWLIWIDPFPWRRPA